MDSITKESSLRVGGALVAGRLWLPERADRDAARLLGVGEVDWTPKGKGWECRFVGHHNAFVNQGLGGVQDSAFADLISDEISHIGVSGDTSTVTASTATLGSPNNIKTTDNTLRIGQTVSADQLWSQADVAFAITKVGFLRANDPAQVSNIIGGVGGAAPYDENFTIDLTNIQTWSLRLGIDVVASAT